MRNGISELRNKSMYFYSWYAVLGELEARLHVVEYCVYERAAIQSTNAFGHLVRLVRGFTVTARTVWPHYLLFP